MVKLFNGEEVRPWTSSPEPRGPVPDDAGLRLENPQSEIPRCARNDAGNEVFTQSCKGERPGSFSPVGQRLLPYRVSSAFCLLLTAFCFFPAYAQVESVENTAPTHYLWVSHGRIEGHLALHYSPAGAFSPDSSILAVVSGEKIVLMGVREPSVQKVLKPHLEGLTELNFQSANFLDMKQLLLLGYGVIFEKGKGLGRSTPVLAVKWDPLEDHIIGSVQAVGGGGGFRPILYFPGFECLLLYKASNFDIWYPLSGRGGRLTIPDLTQTPEVVVLSPDGHWLLLAQIAMSSNPDPVVVEAKQHRFVDSLRGHEGTVLDISFSGDSKKVATACEDGKVRIFSAPEWKLLKTLTGHHGPVHWAEFSPDGKWLVSAGEDKTARVWSVEDGQLQQTLEDSKEPLLTVGFSPDSEYFAASSEKTVFLWQRTASGP